MFLFDRNSSAQYADATRSVSAADLGARVQKFADMIEAEGLSDARICLPLDSGVNALAALIAVMEQGFGAALVPMPTGDEAPLTPPFCDAVVTPAAMDAEDEAPSIERLRPASDMPSAAQAEAWRGHVWLHTSGSTGVPKWLLQRCDRLHRSAKATGSRLKLTPEDRVMTTVPINHSFGLGAAMMSGLVAGSSVRMAAGGNPLAVFQAQRSFEPTVMFMVPSQVRSILALRRKAGRARVVVVSGDKLLPSEAAAFEPDHGPVVSF